MVLTRSQARLADTQPEAPAVKSQFCVQPVVERAVPAQPVQRVVLTRSKARLVENQPEAPVPGEGLYPAQLAVERADRNNWRDKRRR